MTIAVRGATSSVAMPAADTTIDAPTHPPELRPPPIRSQYVPDAIPVATVDCTRVDPLLIETNPLSPRVKAIALAPSSHQWFTSVPATIRLNATMFRIDGSRCSHTQSPICAVSIDAAHCKGVVLPAASDGGPIELPEGHANAKLESTDGYPYGCASIHTLARRKTLASRYPRRHWCCVS